MLYGAFSVSVHVSRHPLAAVCGLLRAFCQRRARVDTPPPSKRSLRSKEPTPQGEFMCLLCFPCIVLVCADEWKRRVVLPFARASSLADFSAGVCTCFLPVSVHVRLYACASGPADSPPQSAPSVSPE